MHLKKGKKFKFILYSLLIIFLTSTNNYNYKIKDPFNIKYVYINGFSEKKNNLIKDEIKEVFKKNIFFIDNSYFIKLIERSDIKYLNVKKNYPNKLMLNIVPANPICVILIENDKIFLGDNGKKMDVETEDFDVPSVIGSTNISNIFDVINLLILSKFDYSSIDKIIFFKSERFDIILKNEVIIKFPIKYNIKVINYISNLLHEKKFANSKIIDLRIENRIIKYE
tara:strand:- start:6746 stop:7420 length:675 start_codon:yes stop_codon:yes gene_type:complete